MARAGRIATVAVALGALLLAGAAVSCRTTDDAAGQVPRDSREDGLFHDFMDGKYDGAGHPIGANVYEAERDCNPASGRAEAEGWGLRPSRDRAGVLCSWSQADFGAGIYALNVRALVPTRAPGDQTPVLTLTVTSMQDGNRVVLAQRDVPASEFLAAGTYQNIPLRFTAPSDSFAWEVSWPGKRQVRVDYFEVFRANRQLVLSPASGELTEGALLQFELTDPPTGATFRARCGETDRTDALDALLADGTATRTTTDFRTFVTVPAAALLEGCPLPSRLKVSAVTDSWVRETSRVTYREAPPACGFEGTGTRVLLTGFEPFPADSSSDNVSERAVQGFDPSAIADVTLMRLTLPVEYDTAAAWVSDVAERCQPDVLVGFGQGRTAVDLETTAYNVKDTSEVSGGVPDNRGVIMGGEPIVAGGPDEVASGLPLARILEGLRAAGVDAGMSDDPGRYICNSVFYTMVRAAEGTPRVGGFVHLPRMYTVDEAAQRQLQAIVETTVTEAVALRRTR
jgi:pyroglutamyl-peptidase